ncbi:MAG: hypothetical protein ACREPA_11000 [Candidatus Dormibacteraceae bacterium]
MRSTAIGRTAGALGVSLTVAFASLIPTMATGHAAGGRAPAPRPIAAAAAFTNYEVSSVPGTVCPGAGAACNNFASEPAIRADRAGNLYATSENGLGGGTEAWKSTDGGRHYTALSSPDAGSTSNNSGFAPGGGDTDLATAPVKNAAGFHNVYVASLSLANVDVSTSRDGGRTFALNPVGALVPGDDREWIAADGASKVCVDYHDVATANIDLNCSFNAGLAFTQLGDVIDANHLWLINNNQIGNLMIDPVSHFVYATFSGIASQGELACGEAGSCGYHAVWMGVSKDGGKTFTDHPVYVNLDPKVSYGHQFVNVSIDRGGNVYSIYSDDHNIDYSYSADHGRSWSAPVRVNSAPANTAIMPWSTAGAAGKLDVVYYGSGYYDGHSTPDNYPASAAWNVYFAQNLKATGGGGFSQVAASPINHYGGVCESGVTCTGNRDLYDDFGVAASPITGLASIVYSDDQYGTDPNSPPPPGCTTSTTNSSTCDHTEVATQTAGAGIFGAPAGGGRHQGRH